MSRDRLHASRCEWCGRLLGLYGCRCIETSSYRAGTPSLWKSQTPSLRRSQTKTRSTSSPSGALYLASGPTGAIAAGAGSRG